MVLATRKTRKRQTPPPATPDELERLQHLARELKTASEDATAIGRDVGSDVADELFIQHRLVRTPKFDN